MQWDAFEYDAPMSKRPLSRQTAIRLPADLLDRLEALAESMTRELRFPVSRSDVTRRALEMGIDAIERERKGARHGKA